MMAVEGGEAAQVFTPSVVMPTALMPGTPSPLPAPMTSRVDEADALIKAVYAHMFGNAYLFAADRACLIPAESAFRTGGLSVKDFARRVAKSPAYMNRFFHKQTTYANIEILAGHLLGRRPNGVEDYARWSRVYDGSGYLALVDAMLDDGEYDQAYGDATVPHARAHGVAVTGADAYLRAATPAGIRLGEEGGGEVDGGALAGAVVAGILAAAVIGYLLSTGGTH